MMCLWLSRHPAHEPEEKQEHEQTCDGNDHRQQHFLKHREQYAKHHHPEDDQRQGDRCQQKEDQKPEQPLPSSWQVRRLQLSEMRWRIGRILFNCRSDQSALRIVGGSPAPSEFPVPNVIRTRGRMRREWWELLPLLVVMVGS